MANWLAVVAGILPVAAVGGYDYAFGPYDNDSIYTWQIFVGPLLIATASALRLGVRRAAKIMLIGVPLAAIATWLFAITAMFVIPS